MNNLQIKKILDATLTVNFLGVFPKDMLPSARTLSHSKYPLCYVVNTAPSTSSGEHWVAYYLTSPSSIEFFDSYGEPPSTYSLDFHHSVTNYNSRRLQSFSSTVCGHYCIMYLISRSRRLSLGNFLSHFSSNYSDNDRKVGSFIKTNFLYNCCFSTNTCFCVQSCKPRN